MPPPSFQRPWRWISWVGAPFWAMRLAMPTRPLCPLKNSQSANPAALATTFTRRAICDSDNPNTFCLPSTPAGRMAESACMAAGVMATTAPRASASVLGADHGEAAAAVVPAPHVAPSQRGRLGAPQPRVGQDGHQGDVELGPFGGLFRCLNAAAALAGLDGGEADDGEHVGGEGAGLALGLGKASSPFLQRGAHARVPAGLFQLRPLVGLGDGAGDQPQGGDGGAGARPGCQVAGHGGGLGRQGAEAHVATPVGEEPLLGAVDALGVVGEDGLQGVGHAPVGGEQRRQGRGGAGDDRRVAGGGGHGRVSGGGISGAIWAGERYAITHPAVKNAAMPRLIPRPTLLVVALPINRDNLGIQEPFRPFCGCSTSVGRDWRLMRGSFA